MAYPIASNVTSSSGLAHLASVYYKKKGLDRLQKKFVFREACMDDMVPKQVGRTVQFYRYVNLAVAQAPAGPLNNTEGNIGTPIAINSRTISATVSQYTSFITVSDLLRDTALDPIVQNAAELLGYQGGLTVDTITRNIIDAEFVSSAAAPGQAMIGATFRVADLRNTRTQLQSVDVEPLANDEFLAIMSPFVSYDLVNDPAIGGLADIFKYNTAISSSPLVKYEDRGVVTHVAGCKVIESTNVKFTAGSPNKYRVYIVGKGAVGAVDLEGRGPNKVVDPKKQRFNINIIKGQPSIADPEGVIGAAVSYNFVYTTVVLDGTLTAGGQYRMRMIDASSSVG
jgi:N4-gp56 family major capsid protein